MKSPTKDVALALALVLSLAATEAKSETPTAAKPAKGAAASPKVSITAVGDRKKGLKESDLEGAAAMVKQGDVYATAIGNLMKKLGKPTYVVDPSYDACACDVCSNSAWTVIQGAKCHYFVVHNDGHGKVSAVSVEEFEKDDIVGLDGPDRARVGSYEVCTGVARTLTGEPL